MLQAKAGEDAQNAAAIKAHPLLARLQLGGGLSTVGYASVRDTAAINKIIYSEVAKRVCHLTCVCFGVLSQLII